VEVEVEVEAEGEAGGLPLTIVAGSDDRVVRSRRQLHDIKDRVKTSHQGREDQMVGILSDAYFDWVGA